MKINVEAFVLILLSAGGCGGKPVTFSGGEHRRYAHTDKRSSSSAGITPDFAIGTKVAKQFPASRLDGVTQPLTTAHPYNDLQDSLTAKKFRVRAFVNRSHFRPGIGYLGCQTCFWAPFICKKHFH